VGPQFDEQSCAKSMKDRSHDAGEANSEGGCMSDRQPLISRTARIRPLWQLTVIAVVSAVVAIVGAGPAHAEAWPINDGFEGNPGARWSFFQEGGGFGRFDESLQRSGTTAAFISAGTGWSSVRREVTLDASGGFRTCGASIYGFAHLADATVALEVIDAATWTYVSYRTAFIPQGVLNYQQVNFRNFTHTTARLVFRISIDSSRDHVRRQLYLDDFLLWCSRPLS
jgi:hypothetical protein